jgi:hypothetical protein
MMISQRLGHATERDQRQTSRLRIWSSNFGKCIRKISLIAYQVRMNLHALSAA